MDSVLQFITVPPTGVDMIFWACALTGTLIFAILTILSFIGMEGGDVDADMDLDADGDIGSYIPFFSVHSLVNLVLGFGWTGVVLAGSFNNKILLYSVSLVAGLLFAYMYVFMKKKMMKLEHNGAYKIKDCVGSLADVYLRIPAKGEGNGKVQVSINGSIHELDGVSDGEALPSGTKVTILSVEGNILTVTKK